MILESPAGTPDEAPAAPGLPVLGTEADLERFVRDAFGVRIPKKTVCKGHVAPFRAFADAYFARRPVYVWKASRGFGGKSYLEALLSLTEALTLRANVSVLGGSGEQSQRVLEAMDQFWSAPAAPREQLASEPAKRETRLRWGNWLRALMASSRSVRGPHPQRLRLDEVDEMPYRIFTAALGQTMALGGVAAQTVIGSTHHYWGGTMTAALKLAKEKGWPVYTWCYRETLEPHGWLPESEVARKRGEVPDLMWQTEYELQEPTAEGLAIERAAVDRMFDERLGVEEIEIGQEVEFEAPVKGGRYATGADWARKRDYTDVVTYRYDVKPVRLVAYLRIQRRSWPQIIGAFNARVTRYRGPACHDAGGIGDVIAGYLTVPADGIILVGRERSETFGGYITGIEHGELRAPRVDTMHAEHAHVRDEDLYGEGHPPDSFVAGALAYRALRKGLEGSDFVYH